MVSLQRLRSRHFPLTEVRLLQSFRSYGGSMNYPAAFMKMQERPLDGCLQAEKRLT